MSILDDCFLNEMGQNPDFNVFSDAELQIPCIYLNDKILALGNDQKREITADIKSLN